MIPRAMSDDTSLLAISLGNARRAPEVTPSFIYDDTIGVNVTTGDGPGIPVVTSKDCEVWIKSKGRVAED